MEIPFFKKVFILILFLPPWIIAQNKVQLPEIIPPSPNAASMGKFIETPVGTATGIPEIGISLFNVEEGDINLPISLIYHAGGVKVEEIASYVGLGWNLNAGGMISRSVVGLPDDNVNGYINTPYTVDHFAALSQAAQINQLEMVKEGQRDYEPDIFNFHFPGYSGKFHFDQNMGQFIQTPYSNVKLQPIFDTSNQIEAFVLTTPEGFKYFFGKGPDGRDGVDSNALSNSFSYSEGLFSVDGTSPSFSHISSWHLMEIISPKGDSVKLWYQPQGLSTLMKTEESLLKHLTNECGVDGFSASFVETSGIGQVLSKIEFTGGQLNFVLNNSSRSDHGSKSLDRIELVSDNGIIKSFHFNYSYFLSPTETGKWSHIGDSYQRSARIHRLKLNSIQERRNNTTLPPYIFSYDGTALPGRFSPAQDFWGFYNGETENQSLVPRLKLPGTSIYAGDANRLVHEISAQAAILKKIEYPTGGTAEYFYESNTASDFSEISGVETLEETRNVEVSFTKSSQYLDPFGRYIKDFSISPTVSGPVTINTFVTGCDNSQPLTNFSCNYFIEVRGITDPSFYLGLSDASFDYIFPAGDYRIKAVENSYNSNSNFTVTMNYQEIVNSIPEEREVIVGGLRIAKVLLDDKEGGIIEKNYSYDFPTKSLSSGFSVTAPVFLDEEYFNGSCSPDANVYKITSFTQAPLTQINGSVIGYEFVTELQKNLIKTEYQFSKVSTYGTRSTGNPKGNVLVPHINVGWLRGNLIKSKEFNYKNGGYDLVRTKEIEREASEEYTIANLGVRVQTGIPDGTYYAAKIYEYGFYSAISQFFRKKKITEVHHYNNGDVTKESLFFYDNNPLLPSSVKTWNSDGKITNEVFTYADDVETNSSLGFDALTVQEMEAVNSMKSQNGHMVAVPIQKETKVSLNSGPVLANTAIRNNYGISSSGLLVQKDVQISKSGTSLEEKVVYKRFDSKGNPLELKLQGGPTFVYIWGYGRKYPIAKIQNATYAEVASALGISEASLDNFDETDMVIIDSLRENNSLKNSMISTFTYEPFIGVKRMKDPNGITTTYEYDVKNQLQFVKDDANYLIKEYKYNYGN